MNYTRPLSLFILLTLCSVLLHSQEQLLKEFVDGGNDPRVIGTIENSILFDISGEIWISGGTTDSTVKLLDAVDGHVVTHSRVTLNRKYYFVRGTHSDGGDYILFEVDPSVPSVRPILSDMEDMSALVTYKGLLYLGIHDENNLGNAFVSINPRTDELTVIIETGYLIVSTVFDAVVHDNNIFLLYRSIDGRDFLATTNGEQGNVENLHFFEERHPNWIVSETRTNMTSAEGQVFFWFTEDFNGYDLYVTDGTTDGTKLLKENLNHVTKFEYDVQKFRDIAVLGNRIYFDIEEERTFLNAPGDLWMSDGTESGTVRIRYEADEPLSPGYFSVLNDELYFIGNVDGRRDEGVFKLVNHTEVILSFDEEQHEEDAFEVGQSMIEHDGKLYFGGFVDSAFSELFRTRGSLESIQKVSEIDRAFTVLWWLHSTPDNLYFFQKDREGIVYLYRYDSETCILSHNSVTLSAYQEESAVTIDWEVIEQEEINELKILRSQDLVSWTEIALYNDIIPHSFIDESPELGINYYKLQINSLNGDSSFSNVEAVNYGSELDFPIVNPVRDEIILPESVNGLRVFDSSGRLVISGISDTQGSVDMSELRTGIYILELSSGDTFARRKIFKL